VRLFTRAAAFFLRIGLISTVLLGSNPQHAQAQTRAIRFETFSVEDGLSQSIVKAVVQDAQGTLWFGTVRGLDRRLPKQRAFQNYLPDASNPNSLSGAGVTAIVEDRRGNLWIGTSEDALNRLNRVTGIFAHYSYSSRKMAGIRFGAILILW
jgi:streptogramin lyase